MDEKQVVKTKKYKINWTIIFCLMFQILTLMLGAILLPRFFAWFFTNKETYSDFVNRLFDCIYAVLVPTILGVIVGHPNFKFSKLKVTLEKLDGLIFGIKNHPVRVVIIYVLIVLTWLNYVFSQSIDLVK